MYKNSTPKLISPHREKKCPNFNNHMSISYLFKRFEFPAQKSVLTKTNKVRMLGIQIDWHVVVKWTNLYTGAWKECSFRIKSNPSSRERCERKQCRHNWHVRSVLLIRHPCGKIVRLSGKSSTTYFLWEQNWKLRIFDVVEFVVKGGHNWTRFAHY